MSEIIAMIDHMQAQGIACNVILEAVKGAIKGKDLAIEERRANDRVRKARERAAKRAALKTEEFRHVTHAESSDTADTETPSPLGSPPLFPKPQNSPPIIPPSAEPARAKAKTGSRLSEDWTLPDDWLAEARRIAFEAKTRLTDEEIRNEADKFRDHWLGKAGSAGRKCDWPATWRNWIRGGLERRAQRHAPRSGGAPANGQHGRSSIAAAAIGREFERQDQLDLSHRPAGRDDELVGQGHWR